MNSDKHVLMKNDFQLYYYCLPFQQLSSAELYAIMALRQEVFVVEQNCPYLDADGKDQQAHHLMGFDKEGRLLAYSRLMPKGLSYPRYTSMGRVLTSTSARGKGLGRGLMRESLKWMEQLYGRDAIKISAQCYLARFYESLGFHTIGEEYLEDDIPHIAMIKEWP